MSTSILSPALRASRLSLAEEFQAPRPFRHVVMPEFFDPLFCQQLLDDFPPFQRDKALNEMGEVGRKAVWTQLWEISPNYRELDTLIKSPAFLQVMSEITGIPNLLYDSEYVGGGTHENRNGQSLAPHVDFNYLPRTAWHRRLNLIVYLNREWEDQWGGNLELHLNPWNSALNTKKIIPPRFNNAVIFETTENSWHGFSAISLPPEKKELSRKSVAIYLYTKERPPAETAPSHGTIYVPDGMPENLSGGALLTEADIDNLNGRFSNLRGLLHFLYRRELQFSRQVDALSHSLDEARSVPAFPLQGYVIQTEPAQGHWTDGWAGKKLSFAFRAMRPIRQLGFQVWVPDRMIREQHLSIDVNGRITSLKLGPGRRHRFHVDLRAGPNDEIRVSVASSQTWIPATGGDSADERELAYKLIEVLVEH